MHRGAGCVGGVEDVVEVSSASILHPTQRQHSITSSEQALRYAGPPICLRLPWSTPLSHPAELRMYFGCLQPAYMEQWPHTRLTVLDLLHRVLPTTPPAVLPKRIPRRDTTTQKTGPTPVPLPRRRCTQFTSARPSRSHSPAPPTQGRNTVVQSCNAACGPDQPTELPAQTSHCCL